jgi:hypothetical protein
MAFRKRAHLQVRAAAAPGNAPGRTRTSVVNVLKVLKVLKGRNLAILRGAAVSGLHPL